MKKLLIFMALSMALTSFSWETEYQKGWKEGYCDGWKDVKGQFAICPTTPIAPIPDVGMDTYKGGYIKGFKKGSKDANK